MIVITVSRKPLAAGSVAANVLEHGCGAINIKASRIGHTNPDDLATSQAKNPGRDDTVTSGVYGAGRPQQSVNTAGRWPANLVLQHLDGCREMGAVKVKAPKHRNPSDGDSQFPHGETMVRPDRGKYDLTGPDGTETITSWDCKPGCPVTAVDQQSGSSTSSGGRIGNKDGGLVYGGGKGLLGGYEAGDPGFGDTGGASRYFKQIGGDMNTTTASVVPEDLLAYLHTMITPTQVGGETHIVLDLNAENWSAIPDAKYHGIIARGEPTPEQTEQLWRVVKPGAHVLLIAPENRKTGHRGACSLEDQGFEIRDAILWVNEAGDGDHLHYVPKSNTKERNAGCEKLAEKRKGSPVYELTEEATEDEEALVALQEALQEAGLAEDVVEGMVENGIPKDKIPKDFKHLFKKREGSGRYGNFHPCLHPDALVMTPVGHRRISTLTPGDLVYAADGVFHSITDVSQHPYTSPNLYEIRVFGTNLTTLASDNHPFLIWRPTRTKKGNVTGGEVQWVEAKDILKGDYTMTPLPTAIPNPTADAFDLKGYTDNEDFWFLFGLYLAEGVAQTSGNGRLYVYPSYSLHVDETDLVGRIRSFFEPRVKVSVYPKAESEKGIQVMAFDPEVGALFVELCGKGATAKVLHPAIWNIDRKYLRAIFNGHMAGDGGKVRTYLQSKTSSEALSAQLRLVGDALGFRSNHHRYNAKPGGIGGRKFKHTSDENHLRFFGTNQENTHREPSRPLHLDHEGVRYTLSYVKEPVKVPYTGDVWNLSVEGSPTFQTAVGMSHNTVKPKEVMRRLLSDIPEDKVVVDPFMGSGTTALACLESGHSFIGIEREAEYIEIADARVRHWNLASTAWDAATIESEAPASDGKPMEAHGGVFDMFDE